MSQSAVFTTTSQFPRQLSTMISSRSCISFFLALIFFTSQWAPSTQIGYAVTPGSEQHGDAPNSSVCRSALANATTDDAKCLIARTFRGCQFDSGFFPYMTFQYCAFDERITPTIFTILWLMVLLGAFASIADSFFSPSLIALARTLRMSQNLAGVTLLAFGNGAPDVFSAVTAITTGDPDTPDEGLGLGFLLGSGLLVNTVTAGLVIIGTPFKMSRRPFMKDTLFYMALVCWSASILIRRRMYYADAIGFLVFYLVYVLVTWGSGTLRRRKREIEKRHGSGSFWPAPIQNCLVRSQLTWQTWLQSLKLCISNLPTCPRLFKSKKVEAIENGKQNGEGGNDRPPRSRTTSHDPPWGPDGGNETGGLDKTTTNRQVAGISAVTQVRDMLAETAKHRSTIVPPRMAAPVIEITTSDGEESPRPFRDAHGRSGRHASTPGGDLTGPNVYPMHWLAPMDQHRQRASSVGSGSAIAKHRRLSSTPPGHTGDLSRERCRRSQSVNRRRASARMSTIGYELPYMVRWIIEEAEWRRSERSLQHDIEEGTYPGHLEPDQDVQGILRVSKRTSRFSSSIVSPLRNPSPTAPSAFSEEDENDIIEEESGTEGSGDAEKPVKCPSVPPKPIAASGQKKITLDLVPKEKKPVDKNRSDIGAMEATEEFASDEADETSSSELSSLARWASKGMWHHFVYYMIPVDVESWSELTCFNRMLQILQIPLYLIFRITIPTVLEELMDDPFGGYEVTPERDEVQRSVETVVEDTPSNTDSVPDTMNGKTMGLSETLSQVGVRDEQFIKQEKEEEGSDEASDPGELDFEAMHGWCKPLNVAQCVIIPTLCPLLLTSGGRCVGLKKLGNSPIPLFFPFTLGGLIVAIIVALTSKWNKPPSLYHRPLFAIIGFVTSIVWIYALAHELVNSLETLGIVWEISEAILGLSIMAVASSIGDIMSNCLLARNGYPRIALSACLGSPLFNLSIGAGLSYTIKISRAGDGYSSLSFTLTQALLFSCLMAVLICNIIVAIVFKFEFHRIYGICLIVFYIIFVTIAILIEMDYIVSPRTWGLVTGTE